MIPLRDDNPTRLFAWVTVTLIATNTGAFLYELLLRSQGELQAFIHSWGVVPYFVVRHSQDLRVLLTLLTAMFLHGGFLHLIGNMLYLWIFGNNVEDTLGAFRFALFYIACGLVGNLVQTAISPNSRVAIVGASGAIAGVLGAYLLLFPQAQIYTLLTLGYVIRIVKLPAVAVLGFWIVVQFMSGLASLGVVQAGGVAWFAHIGGFLTGLALAYPFRGRRMRRYGPY